jgi:hypothetical protein
MLALMGFEVGSARAIYRRARLRQNVPYLPTINPNNSNIAPYGATFEDGYRAAVVCDAILNSAETGRAADIKY